MKHSYATFRGEILNTNPDSIIIKEPHMSGKILFSKEPQLMIDEGISTKVDFIHWIRECGMKDLYNQLSKSGKSYSWRDHKLSNHTNNVYHIKMILLPTLNDVFDDVLLHQKYKERQIASLTGQIGESPSRRVKIGSRILYNWFVTSSQRFMENNVPCKYIYMEVTIDIN